MVCMMVGADPDEFAETADIYEIDPEQQENCAGVYEQADASWMSVLDPHFTDEPGEEIPVIYDDPGDYADFADELKSREILEGLAEFLRTTFALPGPVTIVGAQCGEPNAFYSPDDHQVTYCYELAAQMWTLDATKGFGEAEDDEDTASGDLSRNATRTAGSKGG